MFESEQSLKCTHIGIVVVVPDIVVVSGDTCDSTIFIEFRCGILCDPFKCDVHLR